MKRLKESGIKIVDRIIGGFPVPSLITVIVDPIATPELIIYSMCDYYVPNFKDEEFVRSEVETLGYSLKMIKLEDLKDIKNSRVCIEFNYDFGKVVELRRLAYANELIISLIIPKGCYDERELAKITYVSDGVMLIDSEKVGDRFVFKFAIPKMIGGYTIPNYVRYKTERSVLEIDTSRDIV